jgi:DNA-binding NarL/FixJ family response regulator
MTAAARSVVVGVDPVFRAPGTARDSKLGKLSQRELQVLDLIAHGRSNLGICRDLRLRPKTVEAHVRSLFTKLELQDRFDEHRRVMAAVTYYGHGPHLAPSLTSAVKETSSS